MAQSVERILGKDEVTGSIPVSSSRKLRTFCAEFFSVRLVTACFQQAENYLSLVSLVTVGSELNSG